MLLSIVLDLLIFDSDTNIMSDANSLLQSRRKNCINFAHSTDMSLDMPHLARSAASSFVRTNALKI